MFDAFRGNEFAISDIGPIATTVWMAAGRKQPLRRGLFDRERE
jgi:hypothetical protein